MKVIFALPVTGALTWCPVLRKAAGLNWLVSYHYSKKKPVSDLVDIPADHRSTRQPRMVAQQRKGFHRNGQG